METPLYPTSKRAGFTLLQVLVVLTTLGATAVMFLHPECIEHMLAEVARGVAGGVLLAGVKVVSNLTRPAITAAPARHLLRYGWVRIRHELTCGLVAGFLLGLVVAMLACWQG